MVRTVKTLDRARCERCGHEVLRALVRPLGLAASTPRRFIDLDPTPMGYAPDDHDIEAEARSSGVRTFGVYGTAVRERSGAPGFRTERIHAQHWCNLPETLAA
jgi:hypothetical protein